MVDTNKFELNISFYAEVFGLNNQDKDLFINLSQKITNLVSESESNDLDNPLIQESIFKSAIFCIQANKHMLIRLNREEHLKNLNNYAQVSRSDIQKNFKDLNRLSTIFRNIKEFINLLSNSDQEVAKYPLEILKEVNILDNFRRKLDEIHNSFFDSTDFSFLFKKLIWGIFLCLVNENEIKSSTFDKAKLFFTICLDILIRIPNKFFPRKYGNEMKTIIDKENIINEYFKKYISKDTNNEKVLLDIKQLYKKLNIFNKEITIEGEDLLDKEKIEKIINLLYEYYTKNILINLRFDQRVLLLNISKEYNSPIIKKNNIITIENKKNKQIYLITCNRELFKEEKEKEKNARKVSFNNQNSPLKTNQINLLNKKESSLIMTTYTRLWNLLYWAKDVINNYNENNKYIADLQNKYKPDYYTKEIYEKFIPINSYAKKYMSELVELLNKYQVNSNFEIDLIEFYIYCLSLILENDIHIFSEKFSALLLYNDDFIKASVALCFEIILTIFDITEIEINSIYEELNLDVYDFWKVILPTNSNLYHAEIQKHLEEIDYQLSTFLLWRKPSEKLKSELKEFLENENIISNENEKKMVYKLIKNESAFQSAFLCHNKKDFSIPFINENFKNNATNKLIFSDCFDCVEKYDKVIGIGVLIQRLIIYCYNLNKLIFNNFFQENTDLKASLSSPIEVDEYIKRESELIIKVILNNYEDFSILWGLHIDQFVLCCIILVLDKYKLFDFTNIKNIVTNNNNNSSNVKINKNILHNSYNKIKMSIKKDNEDSHIFLHVKISDQQFINIIDFYKEYFKPKFIKYYNNINNIKINTKIDYFNIQNDFNALLQMQTQKYKDFNKNNGDDNDENSFENLEKPTKKQKISENIYIICNDKDKEKDNDNANINNKNNNKFKNMFSFHSHNDTYDIEALISLLKKLNITNQNQFNFNFFKQEKYSAYRNDNLKSIYNNIIKSELPPNQVNRKIKIERLKIERLNKIK